MGASRKTVTGDGGVKKNSRENVKRRDWWGIKEEESMDAKKTGQTERVVTDGWRETNGGESEVEVIQHENTLKTCPVSECVCRRVSPWPYSDPLQNKHPPLCLWSFDLHHIVTLRMDSLKRSKSMQQNHHLLYCMHLPSLSNPDAWCITHNAT